MYIVCIVAVLFYDTIHVSVDGIERIIKTGMLKNNGIDNNNDHDNGNNYNDNDNDNGKDYNNN